jgi:colicin import membrane protein
MAERGGDRWISIAQSLLLHAALVGLVAYGWWTFHEQTPPPPHTLAIEATVVDAHDLAPPSPGPAAPVKPQPAPPPAPEPEPEPAGPPAPTAEELAQRAKAEQDAADRVQREAEEKRVAEAEVKRQAEENRAAEEAGAKRQAEEKRKAEEKRQAEEKRRAEEKRQADAKREIEEKRKAEEARLRAQREAELQHSLAAEEHVMAARSNGQLASWEAQIQARIQRAWLRPPSARAGINCIVYVTQVPGGEVVNVRLGECNGDPAVRESIQAAAFRASPLPPPPDPALFERNLEIQFKPVD